MSKQNKTISFLYEASKLLPCNDLYTAIRSRMLTKAAGINSTASLTLDLVPRCDACGIVFKNVPPTNSIKPVKKPKCCIKLKNGFNINSKYQILSLKKFNKYKNNKQILITQCKLCKHQRKTIINKIGHKRTPRNPQQNEVHKKKKRKKNHEFSGLKKSAVLSAKRAVESEDNNNRSPKKLKTDADVINLISPVGKRRNTPEHGLNITPNTINIGYSSTPFNDSDVICLDSPKKPIKEVKNLKDMFTPSIFNKTVIEISDSEASTKSPKQKRKRNKKVQNQPQKIEQTPKIKNNNNVVLVAEQSTSDKKKKKLNNLSNFLKSAANTPKPNKSNMLQNFLSTLT